MMGPLILFLTTFIWGTAFLAQKLGADTLGPFAMTVLRNVLGGAFLLACIAVRNWRRKKETSTLHLQPPPPPLLSSVIAGICCGVPLFCAMVTQQIGIEGTTPGVCAFLTTNYVLMVPVGAAILTRTLPRPFIWIGVALALLGTYFLSIDGETLSIGRGEAWTLLCAAFFSVQMLCVDSFAKTSDLLVMSAAQLFTCSVVGAPFLLLDSELPRLLAFFAALVPHPATILPVFYCGVFSSGIAYTLQNVGQSRTPPALAAILLSTESVFGALSGYIVLGDALSPRQLFGCSLVFAAAVLTSVLSAARRKGRPPCRPPAREGRPPCRPPAGEMAV